MRGSPQKAGGTTLSVEGGTRLPVSGALRQNRVHLALHHQQHLSSSLGNLHFRVCQLLHHLRDCGKTYSSDLVWIHSERMSSNLADLDGL